MSFSSPTQKLSSFPPLQQCPLTFINSPHPQRYILFFSKKSLILEFEKYEIDKVGNFSHLEEFLPLYLTLFLAQLKRD